ncbi:MAG: spermidine synthase [Bellilinea sp.]
MKNTTGLIYEKDSAYNYIQVLQVGETRLLRLNDGQGVHSIYNPTEYFYNGPWEQVLVAPFFYPALVELADVQSLAIVGLAAGTTARQASLVFPNIQMEGIEIDPDILAVGREYFGMDLPNLHVTAQDGRWALENNPNRFQIISVDAYRPPYIPWHLTTREFFEVVRDHLTDDGVMVINVGRSPQDRRLVEILSSTILSVFPSVHIIDLPDSFNSILFATVQPTDAENLVANFTALSQRADTPPVLLQAMVSAINNLQPTPAQGYVFTDDRAPIEWITNDMILNFFLSGNAETLQ